MVHIQALKTSAALKLTGSPPTESAKHLANMPDGVLALHCEIANRKSISDLYLSSFLKASAQAL